MVLRTRSRPDACDRLFPPFNWPIGSSLRRERMLQVQCFVDEHLPEEVEPLALFVDSDQAKAVLEDEGELADATALQPTSGWAKFWRYQGF
jgi:hypothetical protein